MQLDEIKDFIISYFKGKGALEVCGEDDLPAFNYLEHDFLDSLGIVALITEIEGKFGFSFTPEEMQSSEFGTVGGLIEIIGLRAE